MSTSVLKATLDYEDFNRQGSVVQWKLKLEAMLDEVYFNRQTNDAP
jgi:hypothetical protein